MCVCVCVCDLYNTFFKRVCALFCTNKMVSSIAI